MSKFLGLESGFGTMYSSLVGTKGLLAPHDTFFNSHFWNPEVLNFTNLFVPRANSCPMGLLSGHLGSHIEFP